MCGRVAAGYGVCTACQVPYVRGWYDKYKDHGLVVIGVHSPEFAFEKDPANVAKAIKDLGVDYPVAMDNARRAHPELTYGTDALQAAAGADVVVLLTEWAQFREIDPEVMGSVVNRRRVVDGRHALDPAEWRAAGWEYRALGRN